MTQTQTLRLSQSQQLVLEIWEKELRSKIYGPNLIYKKVLKGENAGKLKFYEDGSKEPPVFVSLCNKKDIDKIILELPTSTTAFSLFCKDTTLYVNILYYYQTLSNAFEKNGRPYIRQALENWQSNVVEYLGILPDLWIAKIVQKSVEGIRRYRKQLGIDTAAENFEDSDISQEGVLRIQAENIEKLKEFQAKHLRKNFSSEIVEKINNHIRNNREKSDTMISSELKELGVLVKRHTVNKYRCQLFAGGVVS